MSNVYIYSHIYVCTYIYRDAVRCTTWMGERLCYSHLIQRGLSASSSLSIHDRARWYYCILFLIFAVFLIPHYITFKYCRARARFHDCNEAAIKFTLIRISDLLLYPLFYVKEKRSSRFLFKRRKALLQLCSGRRGSSLVGGRRGSVASETF